MHLGQVPHSGRVWFTSFRLAGHPNAFPEREHAPSMSASHALDTAWLLLKDFSFLKDHSPEYIQGLLARMKQYQKRPYELEHISRDALPHYVQRKNERFHPNQRMPKGFKDFTPEQVALFMANDVLSSHPELPEALRTPIFAPDKKHGKTKPAMMFDMFVTSKPTGRGDASHIFSPVFAEHENGKVGLLTVGAGIGGTGASDRQTIHVVPEGGQMKPRVHPRELRDALPARFNFSPAVVDSPEPIETKPALPTPAAPEPERTPAPEGMSTPPGFDTMPPHIRDILIANFLREQGGDVQTGEPMDLAWRMLKAVS